MQSRMKKGMVKNTNKLGRFFRFRKYGKELKLEPLFVEATASMLTGVFIVIWGVVLFSNSFFQFSLYTKLKNAVTPNETVEAKMENIYCIDIDPEAEFITDSSLNSDSYYGLLTQSVKAVRLYAESETGRKIVAGLDFAFLSTEHSLAYDHFIEEVSRIPENMYLVFGGVIAFKGYVTKMMRSDIYQDIYYSAQDLSPESPWLADNLFIGGIHYLRGSIVSGFNDREDVKAAMGYVPIIRTDSEMEQLFFSLPMAMFIAGEVMEKGESGCDFYSDFIDGASYFSDIETVKDNFTRETGRDLAQYISSYHYYNFFTPKDINMFRENYMALSEIADGINPMAIPIDFYKTISMADREDDNFGSRVDTSTQYFFITQAKRTEDTLGGEENDVIIPPGANENDFTGDKETVSGIMAHITALSNLLYNDEMRNVPVSVLILIILVYSVVSFFLSYTLDLLRAVSFYLLVSFVFLGITVAAFRSGWYVPLKAAMAVSFVVFVFVAIIRFMYSMDKRESYKLAAAGTFAPQNVKELQDEGLLTKPRIVPDGIILLAAPKTIKVKTGTENEAGISADEQKENTDRFFNQVFAIIKKYNGSHVPLAGVGILAFWNVYSMNKEDSSDRNLNNGLNAADMKNSLNAALECIQSRTLSAAIDICLHTGELYAGISETSNRTDYLVSGQIVNQALAQVLSRGSAKKSRVIVTDEYKKAVDEFAGDDESMKKAMTLLTGKKAASRKKKE